MPASSLSLTTGQISEPVEVGPGTRVTTSGSGYVEWTSGTLADVRNNVAIWTRWPRSTAAGFCDTLRRVVIRAVATGSLTLTWDESKRDEGEERAYWQEDSGALSSDIASVVRKYKGRAPKRLITIGTSWADGTGASAPSSTSYRGLLNTRYSGVLTAVNGARGGSSSDGHIFTDGTNAMVTSLAATPLGPGDIVVAEMGFNDFSLAVAAAIGGNNLNATQRMLNYIAKAQLATLAYVCVPHTQNSLCTKHHALDLSVMPGTRQLNPAITRVGTWSLFGGATTNTHFRMTYGASNSDTATYTGSGDMIYVIAWKGATGTAGIGQITVDGVAMDFDNARGMYTASPVSPSFIPTLIRIPVTPGAHTVVISGSVFHSEVMFFYRGQVEGPSVLVMPCQPVRLDALVDNSSANASSARIPTLTDSSGGTASSTINAIGAAYSQTEVRNAIASLAAQVAVNSNWSALWFNEGLFARIAQTVRDCVKVMQYDGWEVALVEPGPNWDQNIHTGDAGSGASATLHPNDRGHYVLHQPFADVIDRMLGRK